MLTIICAWCQAVMQEGDEGSEVSHGICDECYKRVMDGGE